jgi:hypothetical protein
MRTARLCSVALACVLGCPAPSIADPMPRESDPELLHTWTMPASSGALASGDLGSAPPEIANALMEGGTMPSIAHRIAQHCASIGALEGNAVVVLRFDVTASGELAKVEPDPSNAAGACLADALKAEATSLERVPAGAALLKIRLRST